MLFTVDVFINNVHRLNELDTLKFMEALNTHLEKNNFEHLIKSAFGIVQEDIDKEKEAYNKVSDINDILQNKLDRISKIITV